MRWLGATDPLNFLFILQSPTHCPPLPPPPPTTHTTPLVSTPKAPSPCLNAQEGLCSRVTDCAIGCVRCDRIPLERSLMVHRRHHSDFHASKKKRTPHNFFSCGKQEHPILQHLPIQFSLIRICGKKIVSGVTKSLYKAILFHVFFFCDGHWFKKKTLHQDGRGLAVFANTILFSFFFYSHLPQKKITRCSTFLYSRFLRQGTSVRDTGGFRPTKFCPTRPKGNFLHCVHIAHTEAGVLTQEYHSSV